MKVVLSSQEMAVLDRLRAPSGLARGPFVRRLLMATAEVQDALVEEAAMRANPELLGSVAAVWAS